MKFVMPALVAGIHVFLPCCNKDVDGRDEPGHDEPIGRVRIHSDLSTFQNTGVAGPSSTPDSDLRQEAATRYCPTGM